MKNKSVSKNLTVTYKLLDIIKKEYESLKKKEYNMSIKPCPFCGGVNIEVRMSTEDREGIPTTLYCDDCGASGPWTYCGKDPVIDKPKLIELWNQRINFVGN
jgi:Lar family restriction alleviation protein